MTVLVAVYITAFSVSAVFLLWAACSYIHTRRAAKPRPSVDLGPESNPLVVALYCQYLVAPQKALEEARRAVVLTAGRHRTLATDDFFALLDYLEARSPASSR